MDLHHPDSVALGNGKRIGAALNNHNAGHQPRIDTVFTAAGDNGPSDSRALADIHFVFLQEGVHVRYGWIVSNERWGLSWRLPKGLDCFLIRKNEGAGCRKNQN